MNWWELSYEWHGPQTLSQWWFSGSVSLEERISMRELVRTTHLEELQRMCVRLEG